MDIYAPLARKIGVDKICSELEDLSFKYLNPSAFESISKHLKEWHNTQNTAISELAIMLNELMDEKNVQARIYGREKRPFAIWRKLEKQGICFEDVADIYAFRIIVDTREDCYAVSGVFTFKMAVCFCAV